MSIHLTAPQHVSIIKHLKSGKAISAKVASADLGITQLSSRIGELERKGFVFDRRIVKYKDKHTGERRQFMEYRL